MLAGTQPGPTPQQSAAMSGRPDPTQQTGIPVGPFHNPINGQPSSVPGTPGISGAIQDLLGVLAQALAPRSIVDRGKVLDQGIARNSGGPPTSTGPLGDQF